MQNKIFYAVAIPILAVLLGIAIYRPSLNAPFQFDDRFTIVENSIIKNLDYIESIWMKDPSRFLTHLSFAWNYHFHQLNVRGYHLVNLGIHFLVAFLFFIFIRQILVHLAKNPQDKAEKQILSVLASLIFLCHPLQTSAVIYVSQRSTLLASFFYLLCLILYISFRTKRRFLYYFFSVLAAGAGLFTKPIIITLPLSLFLCEIFLFKFSFKRDKKILLGLLPYLLILIIVPILLVLWKYKTIDLARIADITKETTRISRGDYSLTEFNVLVTYLRLLFLPFHQNLDYDYQIVRSFFSFPTYLSFSLILFLGYLSFRIYKTQKIFSFCIFWFFITLSLESSVFPISDVIFEHRLYLPMVGFAIFITIFLRKMIKDRRLFVGIMCVVIGFYSIMSYLRSNVWGDRIGFLVDVASKSPNKARVHNNLAAAYHDAGFIKEAEAEYLRTLELDETNKEAHNNLAIIYRSKGKTDEAIKHFERAIEINPAYVAPYFNLGSFYEELGDPKKAVENYQKAIQRQPQFALAYVGLSNIYLHAGEYDLAKYLIKVAINLNPDLAYSYAILGDIYLKEGDFAKALETYDKALKKKKDFASVYNSVGNIYNMQQDFLRAIDMYHYAAVADPKFASAYFNMAGALRKLGRVQEARRALNVALNLSKKQGDEGMLKKIQGQLQELPEK